MELCNSTLDLNPIDLHIGLLRYSTNKSSPFYAESGCEVSFTAGNGFNIGAQLFIESKMKLSDCDTKLKIITGNDTYINCIGTSPLEDEIGSANNNIKLVFTNERELYIAQDFFVLFFTFTLKNDRDLCEIPETQECMSSSRCVHKTVIEFIDTYDICRDTHDTGAEKKESKATYTGVAVFVSFLGLVFAVLIGLQFFHKKSICQVCKTLLCLDYEYDDTRNLHQNSNGADTGLDAPPPNYSDLSFVDRYPNNNNDSQSLNSSNQDQRRNSGLWMEGPATLSIPRNLSFDKLSISSSIPPAYSDVIIHKEKYQVKEQESVLPGDGSKV